MDDALLKQLTRQLKLLNFWISVLGVMILVSFVVVIVLLFKVVSFVHDTSQKVTDIQSKASSTLNVKQQVCDNKSVANVLSGKTDLCN